MFENEEDFFGALGLDEPTPEEDGMSEELAEQPFMPEEESPAPEAGSFDAQVEAELQEIRRYDPTIRTPADLLRLDRREAFLNEVIRHRHSFLEAYRYVYADKIAEEKIRQAERQAAQRTRNSELGKAHMRATTAAGTGGVTVPAEVEKNIRAILPRATKQQIRAFYQRYASSVN